MDFRKFFQMDICKIFKMDFRKKIKTDFCKVFQMDFPKFSKWISNIFRMAQRALVIGPKGPTDAAEGCSSPQELEKGGRRAAIFLVFVKKQIIIRS